MCAYDGSHIYNTCWNLYFYFSPHYFKHIKVSALALLKMVMHSRSGGNLEVMGLLLGKVDGNTMIVMDSFALPVEGTETRVNAQAQAYEYMAAYTESAKQVCQKSNLLLLFYTYSWKAWCPFWHFINNIICFNFHWLLKVILSVMCRLGGWRMQLDGTTVTLAMDAGCPV